MRSRFAVAASARVARQVVALLAVLGGIVCMHGIANQCVTGMEDMPTAVVSQAAATMQVLATDVPAVGRDHVTPLASETGPSARAGVGLGGDVNASDDDGFGLPMAGACLAVVLIGLGVASAWLRRRRASLSDWTLPRLIEALGNGGRDRDPPCLHLLSIRRC